MEFDSLKDYKPVKITDGFEVFKGTFRAIVNFARVEEYSGDNPEFQGTKAERYELEIVDDPTHSGRRLWRRFQFANEKHMKALADMMFTLGLEFKSDEELEKCNEEFVKKIVSVRAWAWTPEGEEDARQQHLIKGIAKEKTAEEKPAF